MARMSHAASPRGAAAAKGASAGVGRAVALSFAQPGWRLGPLARGSEGLEAARREAGASQAMAGHTEAVFAAGDRAAGTSCRSGLWSDGAMATALSLIVEMTPQEFRRLAEAACPGHAHGMLAGLRGLLTAPRSLPRLRGC